MAGGFYGLFAILFYKALPAAFLLLAAFFLGWLAGNKGGLFRAVAAVGAGAGAAALLVAGLWEWGCFSALAPWNGTEVLLHGICIEAQTDETDAACRDVLSVDTVNGRSLPFSVRVYLYGDILPEEGDCFYGTFSLWQNGADRQEGIAGRVSSTAPPVLQERRVTFAMGLRTARRALSAAVKKAVGGPLAGVAASMTTGERTDVSAGVEQDFRTAGLTHLLVVSGLHLTALAGFAIWLLGRFHLSAVARSIAGCAITVAYVALTGFGPSTVRAGVMALLALSGPLVGRESDGPTSLGAAALVILGPKPWAVLNPGIQLSFCCVAALLVSATLVRTGENSAPKNVQERKEPRKKRGDNEKESAPAETGPTAEKTGAQNHAKPGSRHSVAARSFMAAVLILAFTVPVQAAAFGTVPLVAPLAGLLAIPLAGPVLLFGLGAGVLGLLGLWGPAAVLGFFARAAVQLLYAVALAVGRLPGAALRVQALPATAGAACALCLALAVMARGGKNAHGRGVAAGAALALAVGVCAALLSANTVRAVLFPGGQSALVHDNNRAVVFWGGSSRDLTHMVYYTRDLGLETSFLVTLPAGADGVLAAESLSASHSFSMENAPAGAVWPFGPGVEVTLTPLGQEYALFVAADGEMALLCLGRPDIEAYYAETVLSATIPQAVLCRTLLLQKDGAKGEGVQCGKLEVKDDILTVALSRGSLSP